VADTIVPRRALVDALREPFAGLAEEEMKLAAALMQFPYVVSAEELCNVFGVANSSADFARGMTPIRRL